MLKRLTKTTLTRRREQGLALVEAAIVMPIMVLMLGSVAEFGRYFHMRSTMLRATMTGAVYMSDKSNTAAEQLAASRMAACGQVTSCSDTTKLLYPGVTDMNMTVAIVGNVITGRTVTVATNNVIYQPVINLSSMTASGRQWLSIPINVQARMRYSGS